MKNSRQTYINTHRDAWLEINLEYLAQNVKEIKKFLKNDEKFMAIVKADAYGHGAAMTAPTLLASGVDMLGVASIDEGLDLRCAKVNCDILIVGAVPVWALESVIENNLTVSIFSEEHLIACEQAYQRTSKPVKAHIKIDTGMNRIGVSKEDALNFIKKVQSSEYIDLKGIFTHLACAENKTKTETQLDIWENIVSKINTKGLLLHVLNSAGLLTYKCTSNMIRSGIMIYGMLPELASENMEVPELKQILSLKGRITNIHEVEKGEGISYGHTFIASETLKTATIPIGYADGISRALSNKIYAHINSQKIPQIGNITMDQMMFDITGIDAKEGDIITLLDENFLIDTWTYFLGTINYELPCRLKVRLPRIYTR